MRKYLLLVLLLSASSAWADSYRYMDDAGNIFFVDDISRVPQRYISQVIKPTPTPKLTRRQQQEWERAQRKVQHDFEAKEKKKAREKARQEKMSDKKKVHKDESVLLFVSPSCSECARLERALKHAGINPQIMDIVKDQQAFEIFNRLGVGSDLPVTKIGTRVVRGYKPDQIIEAAK